jgi:assimilatory nitrate reductase catalytic subunit
MADPQPAIPVGAAAPGADTHCPYCALQCGMRVSQGEAGFVVEARDFPTNRGKLCRKGWTAAELLDAPDRLLTPLMRRGKGEPLVACSWREALERVTSSIRALQRRSGAHAMGVFGGGGLTNETAYMLGKFARVVLGSRSIDYNGRFCMASAALANQLAFGIDRGLPFPIADIATAGAVLLAGANPAETMPPLMQYFDEQRAHGGVLIVADPRRTATAQAATLHLQLSVGSDLALANGLLHVAIRDKLIDKDFIAEKTTGFDAVRQVATAYWPHRVERMTGVPARSIEQAAHLLGEAASAMIISARGSEQQTQGVNNTLAFINLALALGQVGKPGSGYGCLTGQGNGQGGREHGQKCDQLPGYRSIKNADDRRHMARFWGISEVELPGPGPDACRMLGASDDAAVRGLLVMGANLVISAPDANALRAFLEQLELLVVCDLFLSETAALADVVLPVAQWAEYEGTTTNLEGRVLLRRALREPPGEARTDLQILKLIAAGLERGDRIEAVPERAFDELARASRGGIADYSGIDYARLRAGDNPFWPCKSLTSPGKARAFSNGFPTPDGKARFHAVEAARLSEEASDDYPWTLTTGRVLAHYQSGTQTRRVESLRDAEPHPFIELNPQLAASHGIAEGDWVRVRSRRGQAYFKARLNDSTRLDTLFVPFHFAASGCANLLTQRAVDPQSKIPGFKLSMVSIERAEARDVSSA